MMAGPLQTEFPVPSSHFQAGPRETWADNSDLRSDDTLMKISIEYCTL
jgi:hypothetical protein